MATELFAASLGERAVAGALAGVIGGTAHALVNEFDRRVFRHNADDLAMLGGPLTDDQALARRIGLGMHIGFAATFGAIYAVVLKPQDDGDALRKGLGFAMTENVTLFPLGIWMDRFHPYIRDGRLDRFFTPVSFVEATLRHVALGFALGASYPRVLRVVRS